MLTPIADILRESKAYNCVGCGKCTAVCPVNNRDPGFSPRSLVEQLIQDDLSQLLSSHRLWECLTCGMCSERCHAGVDYLTFVRRLREEAGSDAEKCDASHGGAFQSLARILAASQLQQDRLRWLEPDLRISDSSEVVFFVGCAPYLASWFQDVGARPLEMVRGAIRLLNAVGVTPALLADERCCGHDQLWTGDIGGFRSLAQQNVEALRATGARRVVTACPECYHTLRYLYPKYLGSAGGGNIGTDIEVIHLAQFLAQAALLPIRAVTSREAIVTFHDPCRLGRLSGIFEEPRQLLQAVPGLQLKEMARSRVRSTCCGTHAWINCGSVAKGIQSERLQEARATGADVLVTACPKCEIHLKCANRDARRINRPDQNGQEQPGHAASALEIVDLYSLLAQSLSTAFDQQSRIGTTQEVIDFAERRG